MQPDTDMAAFSHTLSSHTCAVEPAPLHLVHLLPAHNSAAFEHVIMQCQQRPSRGPRKGARACREEIKVGAAREQALRASTNLMLGWLPCF